MRFGTRPSGRIVARRTNTPSRAVCSRETIDIDGTAVTLVRKNIRNMYLRVRPPYGTVELSAPARMPRKTIDAFVRERADWIDAAQRKMSKSRVNAAHTFEGLGSTAEQGAGRAAGASGTGPTADTAALNERFAWNNDLKQLAKNTLNARVPELLAHYAPIIGKEPTAVTYRVMSSRWGSCTPKTGRIRLNLQLGLMDETFLEYVLVHEMTHLWEAGHGVQFQRRMDMYLPNWRTRRRLLNQQTLLEKE